MSKVTDKQRAQILPLGLEPVIDWAPAEPSLRWTNSDWVPTMPPELRPGEPVGLDFEYVPGERGPKESRPFSFAVWLPERQEGYYVPWGHKGGGNLPEEQCHRWFAEQLRDRDVYGLNVKAELHSAYNWGHDPEAMGVQPHDVAYAAALLDETRYKGYSLEALAEEYLGPEERKVHPTEVPAQHFSLAHAGMVAQRGVSDARLAYRIHEETKKAIGEEFLDKVLKLEDDCILPVVDMERTGCRIDATKLDQWIYQCEQRIIERTKALCSQTGLKKFNPDQAKDMGILFQSLGLPRATMFDEKKKEWVQSWAKDALDKVDHPMAKMALEIRHYKSMLSKYFHKYRAAMDSSDTIYYTLHQLRSTPEDDSGEGEHHGTVTGRFSCGGGKYAINIQQVMKCEKQVEVWGPEFIIRELFIPAPGLMIGASDASQIEFRLFSHAAACFGYRATADAYRDNPMIDFHLMVTQLMNPGVTDKQRLKALRKHMKHNNFGVLYGMGREKLARRLGLPCTCPWDWHERRFDHYTGREVYVRNFANNDHHEYECKARLANDIMDEYDAKFPEARKLLKWAGDRAKKQNFIATILGRRRHFQPGDKFHKAFNSWDQGSAADYFKVKLLALYKERKFLGIQNRAPVHDEFMYDTDGPNPRVEELLNEQAWDLHVPLLWETGYGKNWKEANGQ